MKNFENSDFLKILVSFSFIGLNWQLASRVTRCAGLKIANYYIQPKQKKLSQTFKKLHINYI